MPGLDWCGTRSAIQPSWVINLRHNIHSLHTNTNEAISERDLAAFGFWFRESQSRTLCKEGAYYMTIRIHRQCRPHLINYRRAVRIFVDDDDDSMNIIRQTRGMQMGYTMLSSNGAFEHRICWTIVFWGTRVGFLTFWVMMMTIWCSLGVHTHLVICLCSTFYNIWTDYGITVVCQVRSVFEYAKWVSLCGWWCAYVI